MTIRADERHAITTHIRFLASKRELLYSSFRAVGKHLEESRLALVKAYKKAEIDTYDINFNTAEGIREILLDCFSGIVAMYAD